MRVSRFISLTEYCVVEYMSDPLGSLDYYTDDFILLQNDHLDIHQIFNDDSSYSSTRNIKDLTVVPISSNTYAYLDSEKIPDYLAYDSEFTQTSITGYNVVMDKVRFHFVAGFDFDDFKALILNVTHEENTGKTNVFASVLLAPETIAELIIFNPKPLFLGNASFDRYVDLLVPSIKNINEEFVTSPTPASTFVAAITPNSSNYNGFIYNNQISIGLGECERRKTINTPATTYDSFEVSEFYTAQLSQTNEFDTTGATIYESTVGDYLEFYLTFNGGFPSDLISILNARNPSDDWIIIHQISVFEQIGTAFLNTSRFVFFQEEAFDEPNIFRPVLKNAESAVSMSVDYIARLTNRRNGEQIIREASFVLTSPKKYGKNLIKINLLDSPQSQKIYNKIIKKNFESTKLFIDRSLEQATELATTSAVTTQTTVEYVPIFFNNNNVSVSIDSSLIKVKDSTEEVIFGQGKLRFILSPFDNVIKIKVYTTNSSSSKKQQVPMDLNVTSPDYRLVFETDSGKISIANSNDPIQENLSTGLIAFNVSKKDSESIFNSNNRTVYLVSVSQDGKETLMYTGEWRRPTEQSDVDSAIALIIEESNVQNETQTALDEIANKPQIAKLPGKLIRDLAPVKGRATPSVANKFGIKQSRSIKTNSKNAK